jgi:large subunit ribosomal protein L25
MEEFVLSAEVRKQAGKKQVNAVRREKKIPGVFYIRGENTIHIAVGERSFHPLVTSSTTRIINLKLDDGKEHSCILRDIQFDPVTDLPIHFDLQGLKAGEKITIHIPIRLVGIAAGTRDGGLVQQTLHRLEIKCLPKDIPDFLEINIEPLAIGDSVHVKELKFEKLEILESENTTVVAVIPPIVEQVEVVAVTPEAEVTEPELVGAKGKKAEGEGETEEQTKKTPAQ